MADFVHLHVHSEYSLLDGLARLSDLLRNAKEMGMDTLALTDHGVMYGAVKFYRMAIHHGIKPIIGLEAYVAQRGMRDREPRLDNRPYHLTLLARNNAGYRNLIELATRSQIDGFYYKPRIDRDLLSAHADGLIALSGCRSGQIARLISGGRESEAREVACWYREVLGPDSFYLEMQDHGAPEDVTINKALVAMSRELHIPLVATNDVHYIRSEDAAAHDLLLCIQTNTTVNEPKRMRMDANSYYFKSAEEMARLFDGVPQALENSRRVAEACDVELDFGSLHLPQMEVPERETPQAYLANLCRDGIRQRYTNIDQSIEERLQHELQVIHHMGFDNYFLIVWDLVRYARERGILVGPGRGSAAGSIVAYSLGITQVDPLSEGLIFERFLNPERITMPDVDMDFADDRRDEILEYITRKYGRDHVAQIITFGTMAARGAIRDAGRALDMPLHEVDRLAKLIPPHSSIAEAMESVPELQRLCEEKDYLHDLIAKAQNLEGIARHASTHAAGVVISRDVLTDHVPLQKAPRGTGTVTQYTMEDVETIGLLKVDLLGLTTLTVIGNALRLLEEEGIRLAVDEIPLDDPSICQLLSSGETIGVFQVESSGMRRLLRDLQPTSFGDIVAAISLYRPGPMNYIDDFTDRKHGRKAIEYLHPTLEPILRETYGIILYQEQVMRIAVEVGGFSGGEADLLRRAMGKKKAKELAKQRERFLAGAGKRGVAERTASEIFDMMEYFAGYGFNKSHSAAYAVITCQTAYLKAKYPVAFMAAMLSAEKGNSEKVASLVAECLRLGIQILPPDINRSDLDFKVGESAIRFGLGAIKNVGEGAIEALLQVRADRPFASIDDLCQRVNLRRMNRRALECLIRSGAMDSLAHRGSLLTSLDKMIGLSRATNQAREVGQMDLFGEGGIHPGTINSLIVESNTVDDLPIKQKLSDEKELLGIYLSEHPLQQILKNLKATATALCGEIDPEWDGREVVLAGIVNSIHQIVTRKGDPMAFVRLEDLQGDVELVVFPKVYAKTRELWKEAELLLVRGKVDVRDEKAKVICESVVLYTGEEDLSEINGFAPTTPHHVHITISRTHDQDDDIQRMKEIYNLMSAEEGQDRFSFYIVDESGTLQLDFPNAKTRYSTELQSKLVESLGPDSVRVE